MKYEKYIPTLKKLAKELNQSDDDFHLGGVVENLIDELKVKE